MVKSEQYSLIGLHIREGRIKSFEDIFKYLPKTVLAADLGINNARFEKLRKNISLFRLKDLFLIAHLFEIDEMEMLILVFNQHAIDKESKMKKWRPHAKE